jgi:uncharacterized protein YmfQ (DUF2313 family)
MTSPIWAQSDFTSGLLALLPRGRVWPRDPDAFLPSVFDAFPATAVELLPDWEASLGLPDPCAGPEPTLQQSQAQVLARFADSGGQSITYFTDFAELLGQAITITEFMPFQAGLSACGSPCAAVAFAFVWQVNAPNLPPPVHFLAGASAVGEPLNVFGASVLQCEMAARAPAHTLPIFVTGGGSSGASSGTLDFSQSVNSGLASVVA